MGTESIGKYEVLEKIGVGGFGTVFKAYDPHIKRFVAIKTCTTDDEEVRHRFFQEAEIAGNLQHRNIVTVYDFGLQEEVPYLIQEYLTGEDLDRKIKRQESVSYAERILYLVQIARGLEAAHAKGVIHRDIKPANIRILEDGTAKIMDFGIAKLTQRQTGLTQTGMTLGTAAYLAPEQIRGESVDQRTDIFSFGVLAYELLTFQRPFLGDAISNVLYQILNARARPITEFWPECPPELQKLVDRCMEKDQGKRYATSTDLLHDLDQILRKVRGHGRPSSGEVTTGMFLGSGAMESVRTAHLPHAAAAAAAPAADTPQEELELDLTLLPDPQRRTPKSVAASAIHRRKQTNWTPWVAVVLAVLVGGGGWWYMTRGPGAKNRPGATAAQSSEEDAPAPASSSAAEPAAPPPAAPASAPPAAVSPATPGGPAGELPASPPSGAPALPAPPAEATPPEPPKPPEKARLTVAKAWDDAMTVTVDDGPVRRLDRRQNLELEPGDYVLTFELTRPDYSDRRETRVSLKPGQSRTVEVPLQRPGTLSVQQAIAAPIGLVTVDGETWGPSPVRNRKLRPGTHKLEIAPVRAEAEGGARVALEVTIKPQAAVTVTFDLRKPDGGATVRAAGATGG
jgi:serine/threonine-protein kinase